MNVKDVFTESKLMSIVEKKFERLYRKTTVNNKVHKVKATNKKGYSSCVARQPETYIVK